MSQAISTPQFIFNSPSLFNINSKNTTVDTENGNEDKNNYQATQQNSVNQIHEKQESSTVANTPANHVTPKPNPNVLLFLEENHEIEEDFEDDFDLDEEDLEREVEIDEEEDIDEEDEIEDEDEIDDEDEDDNEEEIDEDIEADPENLIEAEKLQKDKSRLYMLGDPRAKQEDSIYLPGEKYMNAYDKQQAKELFQNNENDHLAPSHARNEKLELINSEFRSAMQELGLNTNNETYYKLTDNMKLLEQVEKVFDTRMQNIGIMPSLEEDFKIFNPLATLGARAV